VPTYLLIPLHTSDPIWQFAARRDPVQVIATSEREARAAAWLRFGSPLQSADDPWLLSKWTYAHIVDGTDLGFPVLKPVEPARKELAASQSSANA
jgi:hypothetical protein